MGEGDSSLDLSQHVQEQGTVMDALGTSQSTASSHMTGAPPPLPPRAHLKPYPESTVIDEGNHYLNASSQWYSNDPRSSSTQSLVPIEADRSGRRTLLLIYIHGFVGNETSFQSFPAHVHNVLSITLAETHIVHTKIYPRYKSRKHIEFARDDFSKWLEPHEDTTSTDIVLLGHSLGGIVAAEVALLTPKSQAHAHALRHRILGTVCFDTPFLSLHPGIVVSGISSLFRPAPATSSNASEAPIESPSLGGVSSSSSSLSDSHSEITQQLSPSSSNISSLSTLPLNDPHYNPPFPNDVRIAERKGWGNMLHFVNKHADALTSATKQYFVSHLEFGGCLADFPGLKARYSRIRHLEDVDEITSREEQRVRFVNYYTASTGRPKKPKEVKAESSGQLYSSVSLENGMDDMSLDNQDTHSFDSTTSILGADEDKIPHVVVSDTAVDIDQSMGMRHLDPAPMMDESTDLVDTGTPTDESADPIETKIKPELQSSLNLQEASNMPTLGDVAEVHSTEDTTILTTSQEPLPPLPPVPVEPTLTDLSIYKDKDSRKVAEKEQKRIIKAYQQALKDRDSAVKDREKLLEKRQRKARQEQEKIEKSLQKQREKEEKEELRRAEKEKSKSNPDLGPDDTTKVPEPKPEKAKRERKFCVLPSDLNGKQDSCWVKVLMADVDEVGAHCGLFLPGNHYEGLIGEVASRIEDWVEEDATRRMILEVEGQ